jgi:hypothetical protein
MVELLANVRRRPLRLGSGAEHVLATLLEQLDNNDVRYTPAITTLGMDEFQRAAAAMRGVVVATTHANGGLSRLILWPLDQAGLTAIAVSSGETYPLCGTGRPTETIAPTGTFLLRVRTKLRAGAVVAAMLDSDDAEATASSRADANRGAIRIADPLIRMAVQWDVPIAIVAASLARDHVVLRFEMSWSVDEVVKALSALVAPDSAAEENGAGSRVLDSVPARRSGSG